MSEVIYKDSAIDVIRKNHHRLEGCGLTEEILIEQIQALPSADRPQGEWDDKGYCANCGKHAPYWAMATTYYKSNFCPNCGCRMMKGKDNDSI